LAPVLTKKALKKSGLFASMCDMLFNLNRFMITETRDGNRVKMQMADPTATDWDRWASQAYLNLAGNDVDDDCNDNCGDMGLDMNGHIVSHEMNLDGDDLNPLHLVQVNDFVDLDSMNHLDENIYGSTEAHHSHSDTNDIGMNELALNALYLNQCGSDNFQMNHDYSRHKRE